MLKCTHMRATKMHGVRFLKKVRLISRAERGSKTLAGNVRTVVAVLNTALSLMMI